MGATYLLVLVGFTVLLDSCCGLRPRHKRELLLRSKRRWVLSTIELEEEDPGPYPKIISQMFNDRSGSNHEFRISGMGVDSDPKGLFSIHPHTGIVYAHQPVDRETYEKPFHIKFDIFHQRTKEPLDRDLAFDVEIQDINDNAPSFSHPLMRADVPENTEEGYLPLRLDIVDRDQYNTSNSEVTIRLVSQTPRGPTIGVKQISGRLAQLTVKGCFDYDKIKTYKITLEAKDGGTPSLSSTAVVTLNILDTNTHLPTFKEKTYALEVTESTTKNDILRVAVEDKDTHHTPGWRAKYKIVQGNEGHNYKIETDPKTNEGILSLIKGKDYEQTAFNTLRIEVENEEPLWYCKNKLTGVAEPVKDSVEIKVKVKDVNDQPEFMKNPTDFYQEEEEDPGKVLLTPEVKDVDSDVSHIRYVVLEDPAGWVSIDKKTGEVISAKKMDRESPFLNGSNIYKILIGAIDNGQPPATGTGTIQIHLGDINDNVPRLVNKGVVMCGNKVNKVMVPVQDADLDPYSGPFFFSLGGDDKTLEERWKLEPAVGEEGGLVSRKTLAYGNYSVPLVIMDQQNMAAHDTLEVMVCDCGEKNVCRSKQAASAGFGAAAVAVIFLALLLFLLLLRVFTCDCGWKDFKHPIVQEDGNQTLIKYNHEGGLSECKTEPSLPTPRRNLSVTDGLTMGATQWTQAAPVLVSDMDLYHTSGHSRMNSNLTLVMQRQGDIMRSHEGQSVYSKWTTNRSSNYQHGVSSRYNDSVTRWTNQQIADQLDRRMDMIDGKHVDHPGYHPYNYAYEGQGSKCQSLDGLSLSNVDDDLTFLNDLGPRFKTLGGICQQTMQEKKLRL